MFMFCVCWEGEGSYFVVSGYEVEGMWAQSELFLHGDGRLYCIICS